MTKLPEIVSQRSSITLNNKENSKKLKDEENFKFGTDPNSKSGSVRQSSVKVR